MIRTLPLLSSVAAWPRTFHSHAARGGEDSGGRIIELGGSKRVAAAVDTRPASGDEHLAFWKQSGRVAGARSAHTAGLHKRPRNRIVEFGARLHGGRCVVGTISTGDEDAAVQQQSRRVKEAR